MAAVFPAGKSQWTEGQGNLRVRRHERLRADNTLQSGCHLEIETLAMLPTGCQGAF